MASSFGVVVLVLVVGGVGGRDDSDGAWRGGCGCSWLCVEVVGGCTTRGMRQCGGWVVVCCDGCV